MDNLVCVEWLHQHLHQEKLIVLDASTAPVTNNLIAGSLRFDFQTQVCDQQSLLPNMMPPLPQFKQQLQEMGIEQDSSIVVYDNKGIYSSARAWWMLKSVGLNHVAVLNGGLPAWHHAGYETASDYAMAVHTTKLDILGYTDRFNTQAEVAQCLATGTHHVLDARSSSRFNGEEVESRPGLRAGHISGSVNLPYADIVKQGHLLPVEHLATVLQPFKNRPIIFTCGSGVTACILALAATLCDMENLTVYDGSWTEWGASSDGKTALEN